VRSWGERVTAEVGTRYDHYDAPQEGIVSPRLALALRAGERSVLRAAWGRFAQSERPYELAVGDGETRPRAAERSQQWVVGWETAPARAALPLAVVRLELYHRRIANPRPRFESLLEPLNFFPETEPGRALIAPSSSFAHGAELLLRGRPGARGGWWLAYSWSRSEDRLGGRRVPRATDQPHAVTLDLSRQLPGRWQLDLAWRWHSGWPATPIVPLPPEPRAPEPPDEGEEPDASPAMNEGEPPARAVFGELASRRFPPYHRLDLRAGRSWPSRWGALTFYLDVQNAYARRNVAGFDVLLEEDGTVGLDREHWPGIVPSLGIVWQLGG
jgi:outer membrane receptor protein involved in Fe transport